MPQIEITKSYRIAIAILFFLAISILAITNFSNNAESTITGKPVPPTGTWTIDQDTTANNEIIYIVDGSVNVMEGYTLAINNSILQFNISVGGERGIGVQGGAILRFWNSTMKTNASTRMYVRLGSGGSSLSTVDIDNSTITHFDTIQLYSNAFSLSSRFYNCFINDSSSYGFMLNNANCVNARYENILTDNLYRTAYITKNVMFVNLTGEGSLGPSGVEIGGTGIKPIFVNCKDIYYRAFETVGGGYRVFNSSKMNFYNANHQLVNPSISICDSSKIVKWTGNYISNSIAPIILPRYNLTFINRPGSSVNLKAESQWYILWNGEYYLIPYLEPLSFMEISRTFAGLYQSSQQSVNQFPPPGNYSIYNELVSFNGKLYHIYTKLWGDFGNSTYGNQIAIAEMNANFETNYLTGQVLRSDSTASFMGLVKGTVFNNSIYILWSEAHIDAFQTKYVRYFPSNHSYLGPYNLTNNYTVPGDMVSWGNTLWFIFSQCENPRTDSLYLHIKGLNLNNTWTLEYNYSSITTFYAPQGCLFNGKIYIAGNDYTGDNRLLIITWNGNEFENPNLLIDSLHNWQRYASMVVYDNKLFIFYKSSARDGILNESNNVDIVFKTLTIGNVFSSRYYIVDDNHHNSCPSAEIYNNKIYISWPKENTGPGAEGHQFENDWIVSLSKIPTNRSPSEQLEDTGNALMETLIAILPLMIWISIAIMFLKYSRKIV